MRTRAPGAVKLRNVFCRDFYADIVIGAYKMFAVGTILASPVMRSVIHVGGTDGNLYALQ